ncbi:hypothetical protein GO283_01613 [Ralstonia solanacearum]|nr:hypothetical protein [Ralstonia solanacearum]NKA93103.1 hypothetical protein [Ralstonia solanacearum]
MLASSPESPVERGDRSTGDKEASLQVMVPARIKREVSVRAAQEGTTQRTIILRALKAIGFVVNDDELCDKRKIR